MKFQILPSLKAEHEELHGELARATKAGGRTGETAKAVAKLMHPHLVKEEEYALPPLGLLTALSRGQIESGMAEVIKMTDKLEAELPHMLAEHKDIVTALEALVDAAKEATIVEAVFANEDRLHRRLHGVVDAAPAGALEQRERSVVRVEHHLLRLARIGAHEQHAAVAEPDMGDLHDHRRAVQQNDFVAPGELVGFPRREVLAANPRNHFHN
jgi:hypothetical protein